MTWIGWTVLAVVAVALVLTIQLARYVRRVDRLDAEVQRTRAAMDSQLAVRATRALDLAHSAAVDPATAMLLSDVASRALESSEEELEDQAERAERESELTRSLNLLLPGIKDEVADSATGSELAGRLERACTRARIAHQLHDARVAKAIEIRSRYPSAVSRLLGLTPPPQPFEWEDDTATAADSV